MISKKQFVYLVEGLKKQQAFEEKVDEAFGMLNSSFTICELSTALSSGISDALAEDFTATAIDIIFEFVYQNKKEIEWSENGVEYSFYITSIEKLYDKLCKYFVGENEN